MWNIHSVVEAAKFGDWLKPSLNLNGWKRLSMVSQFQWVSQSTSAMEAYWVPLPLEQDAHKSQFLPKGQFSSAMSIYPSLLTPNRGHQQTWRVKISDRSASQENKKRNSGSGKTHPSDGILNMHEVCSCSWILEVCKTTSKTISKTISTRPQWDCLLLRCIRN